MQVGSYLADLRLLEQNARRRFGQHFLSQQGIVDRIVRRSQVGEGTKVLEIGPGLGILTNALVKTGAEVTAVELDRDLADHIERVFPQVRLVRGDAAKQDWKALLGDGPYTVVANLPYNVGTQLVIELLEQPALFERIVVMLQKEVVDRFLAVPGTKAYNALSVRVQSRARVGFLLAVPPKSFHPPPKVDSSVVRLEPYEAPKTGAVSPRAFDRCVKAAFSQRRKTLPNALSAQYGKERAREALEQLGIDPGLRAEVLTIDQFRELAAVLEGGAEPADEGPTEAPSDS